MSIDRAATLRNAEHLLRQGQLDAAVAEYVQIVEAFPRDWTTANTLGDVYVRAGQVDKAVEQFVRIADGLSDDGFLSKAAALYKKTIRLKPDLEPVLWKAAEVAATQGILADARALLKTIEEKRKLAGDEAGAVRARIRMGTLDRANYSARRQAAAARASLGEVDQAVRDLLTIAHELSDLERFGDAAEVLSDAAQLAPDDDEVRRGIFETRLVAGDLDRARAAVTTPDQLRSLADALERSGRHEEAMDLRGEAERQDRGADPADRVALVSMAIDRGAGEEAAVLALEILREDATLRRRLLSVALDRAGDWTAAAFRVAQLVADSHVVDGGWAVAADAMEAFSERVPQHLPAIERLVEICVDGLLESRLVPALVRLTDANLDAGRGAQARETAEELIAREPWEHANFDRFRRALALLGEANPDAVIAERLSGAAPFLSTALSRDDATPSGPSIDPDAGEDMPVALDASGPVTGSGAGDSTAEKPAPDLEELFAEFRAEAGRNRAPTAAEIEFARAKRQARG